MINFLNPLGFIALAGILIPVLIHLWNKKQQQTVKVGSIRWLQASESSRLSSLKLNDVLLMILRCLIVGLIALVMAQPSWLNNEPKAAHKEAYISPELLQANNPILRKTIDSLQASGYQLRSFDSEFSNLGKEDWNKPAFQLKSASNDYWDLYEIISQKANEGDSIWIFSSAQMQHFQGQKPRRNNQIFWVTVDTEQSKYWLQEAYKISNDSLALVIGKSDADQTEFTRQNVNFNGNQIKNTNLPNLKLDSEKSRLISNVDTVLIDTGDYKTLIYFDDTRKSDSQYLKAALEAAFDYRGLNSDIALTQDQLNASQFDWLFWLSDLPLPDSITQLVEMNGLKVFKDAAVGEVKTFQENQLIINASSAIKLKKLKFSSTENSILWKDSFGNPVLQKETSGKGLIYNFNSRFNYEWNELIESEFFPELMLKLIFDEKEFEPRDLRAIEESQILPESLASEVEKADIKPENLNLSVWILLVALLLMLAERFWVIRRKLN